MKGTSNDSGVVNTGHHHIRSVTYWLIQLTLLTLLVNRWAWHLGIVVFFKK